MSNDNPHYRTLVAPTAEADKLIPPPLGISTEHGEGNTDLSIRVMKQIAQSDAAQARNIARKLSTGSLKGDCRAIREWIYNNFQYNADTHTQKIRSLSHAWHKERESGIDCKSYSVIASQILQNLGYIHYFRRIKQPRTSALQQEDYSKHYTHVYVIVPYNQKTGALSQGYCVIDAVPTTTEEPAFLAKDDTKIKAMKHIALRGTCAPDLSDTQLVSLQPKAVVNDQDQMQDMMEITLKDKRGDMETLYIPKEECPGAIEQLHGLGCECGQYLGDAVSTIANTQFVPDNGSGSGGSSWDWNRFVENVLDTAGSVFGNQPGGGDGSTIPPNPAPSPAPAPVVTQNAGIGAFVKPALYIGGTAAAAYFLIKALKS